MEIMIEPRHSVPQTRRAGGPGDVPSAVHSLLRGASDGRHLPRSLQKPQQCKYWYSVLCLPCISISVHVTLSRIREEGDRSSFLSNQLPTELSNNVVSGHQGEGVPRLLWVQGHAAHPSGWLHPATLLYCVWPRNQSFSQTDLIIQRTHEHVLTAKTSNLCRKRKSSLTLLILIPPT